MDYGRKTRARKGQVQVMGMFFSKLNSLSAIALLDLRTQGCSKAKARKPAKVGCAEAHIETVVFFCESVCARKMT